MKKLAVLFGFLAAMIPAVTVSELIDSPTYSFIYHHQLEYFVGFFLIFIVLYVCVLILHKEKTKKDFLKGLLLLVGSGLLTLGLISLTLILLFSTFGSFL